MVSIQILSDPTDSQIEQMVQMLVRAHTGLTLVDMLTDSNIAIQESWHRLGVRMTALEGRIWVIFEPSEPGEDAGSGEAGGNEAAIVSAIFGFGPGAMPLASEAQKALGLVEYLNSLSPEGRKWQKEVYHATTGKLVEESVGKQKVVDSWVPIIIATDPAHQRRGYASALIRELQRTAAKDGADVFLATFSDELEFYYRSFGFDTKASAEITSPLGSWTHRVMLWDHTSGDRLVQNR